MANNEDEVKIVFGAEADESSGEQTGKKLKKSVEKGFGNDGRIKVPVDITVPIDDTNKKLTEAQKAVTSKINKMMAKGFSASGKDIDALTSKFKEFTKTFDSAGKGRQNAIFKEIRKQVEEIQKAYKALKAEQSTGVTKVSKTSGNKKVKKTPEDRYLDKQEKYSERAQGATKRAQYKGVETTGPQGYKTKSGVDASKTSDYMIRLSEYSAHGSNWANELARVLKEEIAKSAEALVTRFDKSYEIGTDNKIHGKKSGKTTDEKTMLTDTITKAKKELSSYIAQLEAGSEKVTLDMLKESAAVIKVLTTAIGKTTEDAEKTITQAIQGRYDQKPGRLGGTGLEEGQIKGVGPGHENTQKLVKQLNEAMKQWDSEVIADKIAKEMALGTEKTIKTVAKKRIQTTSQATDKVSEVKLSDTFKNELNKLNGATKEVFDAVRQSTKATETQTNYDKIENAAERVADNAEGTKNTEILSSIQEDTNTGFNTDSKADELIQTIRKDDRNGTTSDEHDITQKNVNINVSEIPSVLRVISDNVKKIVEQLSGQPIENDTEKYKYPTIIPPEITTALTTTLEKSGLPDLYRYFKDGKWMTAGIIDKTEKKPTAPHDNTDWDKIRRKRLENDVEQEREETIKNHAQRTSKTPTSGYINEVKSVFDIIKQAFYGATKTSEVDRVMAMNREQQEKLLDEHITKFGLADKTRNVTATGDKIRLNRVADLWNNRKGKQQSVSPFADLKLTEGIGIDAKGITEALQTSIEKNMFSAQTGVSRLSDIVKLSLGGIGMPSLEKSRAEADAANEIMKIIRDAVMDLLTEVQVKETALRGMEKSGNAKFNDNGQLVEGTSEAYTTFAEMEDLKMSLRGVLAEANMVDQVAESTKGNVSEILQQLGFASPELAKCNKILKNINSGLDKNGKALKFQKRIQETLNYSFQLLTRHIGQMIKNWIMMLNPINLIKKAFSDFASYDTKWQRTMNVIKYNLRRIIRPAMEWIAQQIVNMIGLVNALIKGIGKAFGKNWDLFDKDAAEAEKIREELEAAANVTLGFDELHDIGSDNSAANDLSGDIYTPQWEGLNEILEKVGTTIGNIAKFISGLNFWQWLAIGGAALLGFLALKALINWFSKGKNPLQSVADGFSFLEKAVGWAILIWALTEFTKALTDFVDCMKTADWEDIVKSLLMLGGAFAELFLTAGGLMYLSTALGLSAPSLLGVGAIVGSLTLFTKALTDFIDCMKSASWEDIVKSLLMLAGAFAILVLTGGGLMVIASALGMLAPQMLGLAVVIAAFAPVIWALSAFVEAIKGLTTEDMLNGLLFLAGAFMAIAVAIGVLLVVLSAAIASGVGALAILALAGLLAVVALVIVALAELVRAMGEAGAGIKLILEGVATVIESIGNAISQVFETIGNIIIGIVDSIANGIATVLTPILELIDSVIGKVLDLAGTIAHEIGETIRTVIKTTGDVIISIIDAIIGAVPRLLKSIVGFCNDIGPAIENSVDAICRSITKLVNFVVSAVEYMANLVIGAINKLSVQVPDWVPGIGGQRWGFNLQPIEIPRFVPKYEQGTNYVPNDGLAYLHQGEAVIPKKYNQPYSAGLSAEERNYMERMIQTMNALDDTMKQGIAVKGEFKQRGNDLVATVEKAKNRNGNQPLNNPTFAR